MIDSNKKSGYITAVNGKLFSERTAAEIFASRLADETGEHFQVVSHTQGGYYIQLLHSPGTRAMTSAPERKKPDTLIVTRPALRSFVREIIVLFPGLTAFIAPIHIIQWVMIHAKLPVSYDFVTFSVMLVYFGGLALVLWAVFSILFVIVANKYTVTDLYVESQNGIVSRRTARVELDAIRTVNLKQGIVDRLLNTGTLYFSSAGTAGVDVVFSRIRNPRDLEDHVNSRRNLFGT